MAKEKTNKSKVLKLEALFEVLRTLVAIGLSMLLIIIIVAIVSDNPLEAIKNLLLGPLSSFRRFGNVVELMIPLTFTGLAISIVLKSKRFNLVSDSAFFLGGMVATIIGIFSPLPAIPTLILALIAAFLAGGLVGSVPALLNSKFGSNELVTSLMLNYVVSFFVKYLFNYKVRDTSKQAMQSLPLKPGVDLPIIIPGTRIHVGIIILIALVLISGFVIYRTRWGYALRATGSNENFARYSGMKIGSIVVLAQVVGTGIAGLGGAVELIGIHKTFKWLESPGYGFDGVIISTLARGNPYNVPLAAFFLAYVRVGADILNRSSDLPAEIISVVQASIILLIAAQAFLAKFKHRLIVKRTGALETQEGGQH
ncbi:hypothetical protein AOC36_04605 [Erysipelothrix larvae]|uniref:ABC transporter permease n=1 Tax=Erysipelothrix larvae TaxID=1514105 RepID=A0A0X8GZH3_9FIRM|nr:ABC transporter permease [Erysipelothrix larvae]AMC93277.1 hypothetical protein AOC36_04605 [Erysipelothrix larvae]